MKHWSYEAGTYFSHLFTEPFQNSTHDGISLKGRICEGVLKLYPSLLESLKMGDFNTNASEFPNIVVGRTTCKP